VLGNVDDEDELIRQCPVVDQRLWRNGHSCDTFIVDAYANATYISIEELCVVSNSTNRQVHSHFTGLTDRRECFGRVVYVY